MISSHLPSIAVMKKKTLFVLITGIIVQLINLPDISAQKSGARLFEVRKIYIEQFEDEKPNEFRQMLKNEFRKRMIQISDEPEKADAVLSIKFLVEITLHGSKEDLDKPIFEITLSTRNDKLIWKTEIKFQTKGNAEKDYKYAAKRIVQKFIEGSLDSKRRAKN